MGDGIIDAPPLDLANPRFKVDINQETDKLRATIMIPTVMTKTPKLPKLKVKQVILYCTACTCRFVVSKKDEDGNIIKQQVCPHTILEGVN